MSNNLKVLSYVSDIYSSGMGFRRQGGNLQRMALHGQLPP